MKRINFIPLILILILITACQEANTAVPATTSACQETAENQNATVSQPQSTVDAPAATQQPNTPRPPTATPIPPKALTVCMGRQPENLYLYGEQSLSAQALRHAIYESLYTALGYGYQPQGLAKLPHPDEGDVSIQTVTVRLGDPVVDFRGESHVLREGLTVFNSDGSLVTVSDQPVIMQQMTVDFTLKPLVWSDGMVVTAADSVFSYQVFADPETPGDKRKVRRTASYEATGDLTLRWTGLPGYLPADYVTHVWEPLPQHQLGSLSAAELLSSPETTLTPLSSGPFVVSASTADGLTLVRNPNYYRSNEGLPYLEILNVRFVPDGEALLATGLAGCDVTTQDLLNFNLLPELQELDEVETAVAPSAVYEHIDFSVNFYLAEGFQNFVRPDWFQDPRVRQGIMQCTDRQRMVNEIFSGQTTVMPAYIPANHPLYPADLSQWPFDPAAGNALLDAAGYRDTNGDGLREDPTTGASFSVRLTTDNANPVRARAAAIFQQNLAECGIEVVTEFLPPEDWYNDGPLGLLFGRRFELGMFAWLGSPQPACHLWLERNITGPTQEGFGGWGNVNVSGWANAEFEAACNAALNALPGTAVYVENHQAALRIWAEQVPMVPLFNYLKVAAVRQGVTGLRLDPTQPSELWNVYEWDVAQ